MVDSIMVPVDLAHKEALDTAVSVAGALAKANGAKLTLVGVTGSAPSEAARSPAEFEEKLTAFAASIGERLDVSVACQPLVDNDVTADLGDVLIDASRALKADLIVMASHVPGLMEHVIASNAGYVASHAPCSVYVVRT